MREIILGCKFILGFILGSHDETIRVVEERSEIDLKKRDD